MHILPGMPPYTDTSGRGKIRVGKDCQPLTGSLRRRVMVETGTTDFTADEVPGPYSEHISAAAMERLRDLAKQERAPQDLVTLSDRGLLSALGAVREERLTNREIRQIVRLDRNQVYRLVQQLMEEEPRTAMVGNRRYARYEYR